MQRLAAKPVAEKIRQKVRGRAEVFKQKHRRAPKLVVVLVGEDPASVIYTTKKGQVAIELGMEHETVHFPASASIVEVRARIERLNKDPEVDGILIQRPLPKAFPEEEVIYWVDPSKDVDCFHPENVGLLSLGMKGLRPCTPAGVMEILDHYQIPIEGRLACVIGRSSIVGKPMVQMLLQANATVLQCHRKTRNLSELTRQAEILVVAAGVREIVDGSMIRPGATVIDVGIHRREDGKVVGDVQFDSAAAVAGSLTPVPGGVGPMTIAMLMENTVIAAEMRERG